MRSPTIFLGAALMLALPLGAQPSGSTLPPEDPRLYQLFFHFHDQVSSAIHSKKAQDQEGGVRAEKGFAQRLRIKHEELQKVTDIAHGFVTDLSKWQDDLKSYVDKVRSLKQLPDPVILAQFDQKKRQLIDAAVHQTRTQLSPANWAGLHAYINDEHRLHTSVVQMRQVPK